ncbi:MAG: aminomethyl-transferring glycine dehydrogenase [Chitinophagales bacterium]|nr:aminomethyl-transferring glycine dehydrogenase [Chitinophagales bacterium]
MKNIVPKGFASRHMGINDSDIDDMLKVIGASSLDDLISEAIPESIRLTNTLNLPVAMSEQDYLEHIGELAKKNQRFRSYIGLGYHNTITPPTILRNIFENPGWYTQYTPYQAEIAQGRLESLLNFQTMVSDLTGFEVANASLLDEGTAAAEAMIMLYHAREKREDKRRIFFVSEKVLPQTIDVLKTRSAPLGIQLLIADHHRIPADKNIYAALLQYPDSDGRVEDHTDFILRAHDNGVKIVIAADLLSLTLLKSPGELGAEVAVGSAQRFGVPLGYGGPHAAYFATKDAYIRHIPGRIIGVSVDAAGNPAYRMALQTREQHIKREKATSNICTAQALLANMAAMYAVYHGPLGLKEIALDTHLRAIDLAAQLEALGYRQTNEYFFDTLKINIGDKTSADIRAAAEHARINFRYINDDEIGISLDESVSEKDVQEIVKVFTEAAGIKNPLTASKNPNTSGNSKEWAIPKHLRRTSSYLNHPVFNSHHSETQLMRYMKSLENKDLALNTSMIPLGSCTMKLNSASEMIPVSLPEFSQLHPFIPVDQAAGYQEILHELEIFLCKITGFAACSLQPNSGAQGEYAGLMVIMAYHRNNKQHHRNVVLIPSSAHGTNPASAIMAGMKVVVVRCDENGNVELADLKLKAIEHKDDLAALMITYPSTHGVFEEQIQEICNVIHLNGGLVYLDGANMNAQVGLTSPASIGADVNHINLHKTFSIPHGGGGPGMGPICVVKELAPYLPGHSLIKTGGEKPIHAISAAPWGSASILLISYGYIRMLGAEGCTMATKIAILNANYIKSRLEKYYSILYQGKQGRCAHEMIVDMRSFKKIGIEVEDIAKRLIDYGFHAPTISFPVPGTMMIEPTESEDKAELDRFCDALISIYHEIQEVGEGIADKTDNVLKNAPHTLHEVTSDGWKHSYSRMKAAYPLGYLKQNKFWASIARVNNTYGDRNLICTCPPVESYIEEPISS